VCKHFLVAFCPFLQFDDTRADIGPCHRTHEEYFRRKYNSEAKEGTKHKYERRLLMFLKDMIENLDQKIARDKERLGVEEEEQKAGAETPAPNPLVPQRAEKVFSMAQKERLDSIDEEIKEKQLSMERYGNEGRVDEAQKLLTEVELLKRQKEIIHDKARKQAGWTTIEQSRFLRVCEVCGAYLGVNKNKQQHTDNHWQGRLHMGFEIVRETANELEERIRVRKESNKDLNSESEEESKNYRERARRRKRSRSSSRYRRSISSSSRYRSISRSRRKKKRRRGHSRSSGYRR